MEVNLSPSLQCDDPIDHAVKSALVADVLNVVGVPATPISLGRGRPSGGYDIIGNARIRYVRKSQSCMV